MKRIGLIFAALFFCNSFVFSQIITKAPLVDHQPESSYGICNIIGVIVDEESTFFIWEYITAPHSKGSWLAMSSSTILTSSELKSPLQIEAWGIFDDDDPQELNLNERYDLRPDQRYVLYMVFPKVPHGIEKVDISTNTGMRNDLVWKGIRFNNSEPITESNYDSEKNFSRNDDFEVNGSGTGFAIAADGLVATCHHVVEGATVIRIRGVNGDFDKTYSAKVVATDKNNDLAILKIEDANLLISNIPYHLLDKNAEVGEEVFALGYPLRALMGDEIKLTNGIVSSKSGFQGDMTAYQTSVAVQSGNSGCPLFDQKGNVIGIISARLAVESAAYAVKSPYIRTLVNSSDLPMDEIPNSSLAGKPLSEQVKAIKKFIYIIEIN